MRVAFAGTPPFAATALEAIAAAGHQIPLVFTQPDRPAGRGMRLTPSAVAEAARALGLPTSKPTTLRDAGAQRDLREARVDVMVVAAYGLLLPPAVLEIPTHGCINIHASLLPRWRGAAPIQRAIMAGDERTGVSIMQMDAGLDTGPVLLEESIPIRDDDTAGSLTMSLARLGADAIVRTLARLGVLEAVPQEASLATHAPKISKAEAAIDWTQPASVVWRQVRAFNPVPGAEARLAGDPVKVWEAFPVEMHGPPGTIVVCDARRLVVACAIGALDLRRIQRAGGKPVSGPEFARGGRISVGAVFDPREAHQPAVSANPLK